MQRQQGGFVQVLRRGGAFHCLEFSQLAVPGLRELYDTYSFNIIPRIGRCARPASDACNFVTLFELTSSTQETPVAGSFVSRSPSVVACSKV
jgi:ubiquinone/menaquinone biosynthesis C-methylase UbiE